MHYFKFNIGDYHKKAGRLSMLEHGAYTLLLHSCYDREQFPTEEEALKWCWARSADEIAAVKFVLQQFFSLEDGRYVQSRIAEEIETYRAKSDTNRAIALEREARKRTKREPDEQKRAPNHKPINQETINQEPNIGAPRKRVVKPDDVTDSTWDAFLQLRKGKRAAVTDVALEAIRREAGKVGISLDAAMREMCARGWQGFKADWMQKETKKADIVALMTGRRNVDQQTQDYINAIIPPISIR